MLNFLIHHQNDGNFTRENSIDANKIIIIYENIFVYFIPILI